MPPTSTNSSIRIGELIGRITTLMREHDTVLPSDLTLMFKALITLEGLGANTTRTSCSRTG